MIAIFNAHLDIEGWVTELHEDYEESSVAAYFAYFSTIMNAAVKARLIPASPCVGIQVTSGSGSTDKLIATPVQALRGAMRLYETAGLAGFVLCLLDFWTGARWGELVGQTADEYDAENGRIPLHLPLKEIAGKLYKAGADVTTEAASAPVPGPRGKKRNKRGTRAKTPTSERWVTLAPSIAVFYELLLDSHDHPFVFVGPDGGLFRRTNFRARFWRPAWDGVDVDDPESPNHRPPILEWLTFHEGRHTHENWLVEDKVAEVARRAQLGHKMKGIARVYEHVTPVMAEELLDALERRWDIALLGLTPAERAKLIAWFPHLEEVFRDLEATA
ncbi:hypothetical protein [Yinghuangia sp. YIM S10712]|uniref:hypothetical protein n=1 Tax=Yinghuangia sp. YIM S10712 TaxID=3436930 RepID=UPI003F52A262